MAALLYAHSHHYRLQFPPPLYNNDLARANAHTCDASDQQFSAMTATCPFIHLKSAYAHKIMHGLTAR